MKRPPLESPPQLELLRVALAASSAPSAWRRFWSAWGRHELLVLLATLCIGLLAIDVAAWLALFTMLEGRH